MPLAIVSRTNGTSMAHRSRHRCREGAGQTRNRRLQRREAIVERQQSAPPESDDHNFQLKAENRRMQCRQAHRPICHRGPLAPFLNRRRANRTTPGVFKLLGFNLHFAAVKNGQAKRVERSLADLSREIDTCAEFMGGHARSHTGERPGADI